MRTTDEDPLGRALAALPTQIVPPRNLWPEIARDLSVKPARRPTYLAAARIALVAAGMASTFTWFTLRHVRLSPSLPAIAERGSFGEPADPRYVRATQELEETFRERLVLLDPASRAQIEASLAVIREAHEKIRRALMDDPSSAALESIWQSTWRDEIDLYDHVVRITDSAMTRS